jgi:3-oxoacyl-[acyl-carrier protein] reductase
VTKGLAGKTAIVTGASRGIGAGIAKKLAAEGATVAVNYATNRSAADAVVARIVESGGAAWPLQGDISRHDDVGRMFGEVSRRCDWLDIFVNNAGLYEAASIEGVTADQFHRPFDTNVLSLLLCTQMGLPSFKPRGGSVINIGALSGQMASHGMSAYAGTKGATLSLSKELGSRQIRVNAVTPVPSKQKASATAASLVTGCGREFWRQGRLVDLVARRKSQHHRLSRVH